MIKLKDILLEDPFDTYEGLIRVTFDETEYNASQAAEAIRSVATVTVARLVDSGETQPDRTTLNVKLRTLGSGEKAFNLVRQNALKIPGIRRVEIGFKTIEKI